MNLKDIKFQSNDYLGNDLLADVIGRFSENQTLAIMQEFHNLGIGLKILKNSNWIKLSEYKLPFERFVMLYDDNFKVSDIGVY